MAAPIVLPPCRQELPEFVPAEAAQNVADLMVAAGIKVIWNFAPTQLRLPADVFVRNEDLAAQLATLSYHLAQHQRQIKPTDGAGVEDEAMDQLSLTAQPTAQA
jgi:hypothetical protein